MSDKPNIIKIFLPFVILLGVVLLIEGSVSIINNFEENLFFFVFFGIFFSLSIIYYGYKLNWGNYEEYKIKILNGVVMFFVSIIILFFLYVAGYHLYDIIVEKNTTTLKIAILIAIYFFILYLWYRIEKYRKEYPEKYTSKLIRKVYNIMIFLCLIGGGIIGPFYLAFFENNTKAQSYMAIIGIAFVVVLISVLSELPKKWKKK